MIRFNCSACGKRLKAPDHGVGRKTSCPRCGQKLLVPPPARAARPQPAMRQSLPDWMSSYPEPQPHAPPGPAPLSVNCPGCGERLTLPEEWASGELACPLCGIAFLAVARRSSPAPSPRPAPGPAASDIDRLPEVLPAGKPSPPPISRQPPSAPRSGPGELDQPGYTSHLGKLLLLGGVLVALACVMVAAWLFPTSELGKTANEFMPQMTDTTLAAKNPLLVMGIKGAMRYTETPEEQRDQLDLFAQPWVWGTFLVLALLIGVGKDCCLTLSGPFTTPLDAVAFLVHWVGFVIGMVFVFADGLRGVQGDVAGQGPGLMQVAGAVVGVCVCLFVYAVVFVVFSTIEAVIVINPFPFVAAGLKTFRNGLILIVSCLFWIHPVLGFVAALVIFLVCLWLFHFSLRLTILSTVYSVGIFRRIFGLVNHDEGEPIRAFACWGFRAVPWFSCGRLQSTGNGDVQFAYKPLFLLWERAVALPAGKVAVAVGSINPYLLGPAGGQRDCVLLRFSPVYCGREEWLSRSLCLGRVKDISLLTSLKQAVLSIWNGLQNRPGESRAAATSL